MKTSGVAIKSKIHEDWSTIKSEELPDEDIWSPIKSRIDEDIWTAIKRIPIWTAIKSGTHEDHWTAIKMGTHEDHWTAIKTGMKTPGLP